MKNKISYNILTILLSLMFATVPTISSLAFTATVDYDTAAEPRALLTRTKDIWSSSHDVQFRVTYVVNDGTSRIVEVRSASIVGRGAGVSHISTPEIYLAPGGAYARISSDYIKNNSSSATAIAVLYP